MLIGLIALPAAGCDNNDASASDISDLEAGTVIVAVENRYPPYNFIPAGEAEGQGWDYDAWREICDRLNCTAEFVEAAWPDIILETGQGEYDVAADGILITDARKEVVEFSDPYLVVEPKFMIRADEERFGSADEIVDGDYLVGTEIGTTNVDLGIALVGVDRIREYEQPEVAVRALISGDVDAVIIDDIAGHGNVESNAEGVELLEEALERNELAFIFPPGSDLIEPVNAALEAMAKDGTLNDLFEEWFIDFTR